MDHPALGGDHSNEVFPSDVPLSLPALIVALRPAQWTKNAVLLAGVVFARRLDDPASVAIALIAVFSFSLISSGIYLLNDVRDIADDRHHPVKRFRPIASGRLTPRHALIAAFTLLIVGFGIAAVVRPLFLATASGYVALMVAYTVWFKRIVLVDVFVIAGGFVLRAVAGAVAVTVPISPWLLLCTMLLALFLGFCKRRHEITLLGNGATVHRATLAVYSPRLLGQFIATSAASTIVAYSIYTFDAPAVPANNAMMLTIPFVAFAVYRYLVLVYRHRQGGNPEWLLLRDRPLLAAITGWGVASLLVLYIS